MMLTFPTPLHAATYEVAQRHPQASDDGNGSQERPWKSISKAAEMVRPGDVVLIRDGVYRERVFVKTSGTPESTIRFEAAPAAHVVLTGADQLTHWEKAESGRPIYRTAWPHRFIGWSTNMTHPDDLYHRLIGRCEQVAIDGYLLRQVLEAHQLAPGTFFVDVTNQALQVWDPANRDLTKAFVEASVRQEVLRVEGKYVEFRGLHFRFAANMAQHGAVVLAGDHDVMEDCTFEAMNASGAAFSGERHVIRRCVFRDNGQLGFGANRAHELLFTECLVENNNTKGFDRGWEAGGDKLVLCRNAILEKSQFRRNRGNGIWFDIGNENCIVRQCLIADNEDSGIFYEISFGLQAHDNVIVGNGFAATAGGWGAQAGISISSSPECALERNLILGNREGFNFREQTRTTPRIGQKGDEAVWNHDELIRHNVIADNRDAQVWGWFDMKDNRHWPAEVASQSPLSLEKLQLSFVENVYFAQPGQGGFNWGVTWARHQSYPQLSDFQTNLHIDKDSSVFDPGFAGLNALDLRVTFEVMARLKGIYPSGPVPGVILGLQP